jgi:hypothetical protein
LPSLERPGCSQRREQPQQRPVRAQQHVAWLPARFEPAYQAP